MEQTMTVTRPIAMGNPFAIGRVIAERIRQFADGFTGRSVDIDVEAAARAARAYALAEAQRSEIEFRFGPMR